MRLQSIVVIVLTVSTILPFESQTSNLARGSDWQNSPQSGEDVNVQSPDQTRIEPRCESKATREITISCTFSAAPQTVSAKKGAPRVVLNRAEISFEPIHESHMRVELEFTNEGKENLEPARPVYLVMDNDFGQNVLRRLLPHTDLSKIRPGERATYSESFLVGAFVGGHYTITLWIPDPDPSRFNIPAYNLLLSCVGVPNLASGLNILGHFSIVPSMHSSREK